MPSSRTRCLSTKLTEAEYATLERAAGAQTPSAWARDVLLRAAAPAPPARPGDEHRVPRDGSDRPGAVGARADDTDGGCRIEPPTDDRSTAWAHGLVSDSTPRVGWRSGATDQPSRDPDRTPRWILTRSSAWVPSMLVLACLSASGIGAYRYTRIWTPLQRQYLASYVWSAVAITGSGSYELLTIVDATERRTALDADVVPVGPTTDGDAYALTAMAVSHGAVGLAWQRGEYEHAALHAFLRRGIYQDQALLDLARPALWGALVVFVAGVAPAISDVIAWVVTRRAGRSAPER
jgi:hypothetical protein